MIFETIIEYLKSNLNVSLSFISSYEAQTWSIPLMSIFNNNFNNDFSTSNNYIGEISMDNELIILEFERFEFYRVYDINNPQFLDKLCFDINDYIDVILDEKRILT